MSPRDDSVPVRRILIVGGGSAGWITAGVLAARFPQRGPDGVSITLVEARGVPPIGVGEGTWPTIRSTLQQMGASETDFLRECDASFKQGTRFSQWVDGSSQVDYYHPFTLPSGFEDRNLASCWTVTTAVPSFAAGHCFQTELCGQGRAPKQITMPEFAGLANYAYHLDSGKFVPFLHKYCIGKLGVVNAYDEIVSMQSDESGDISTAADSRRC